MSITCTQRKTSPLQKKVPHRGNLPGTGVICSEISPTTILACHSTGHEIIDDILSFSQHVKKILHKTALKLNAHSRSI